MPSPRLLVIEGNSPRTMAEHVAVGGTVASQGYAKLLLELMPGATVEACFPADPAAALPSGGPLYLYGPYRRAGVTTAPSNEAFDQDLRRRDPAWGLRDLEAVAALAAAAGFSGPAVTEMPANNLSVVFRRL